MPVWPENLRLVRSRLRDSSMAVMFVSLEDEEGEIELVIRKRLAKSP